MGRSRASGADRGWTLLMLGPTLAVMGGLFLGGLLFAGAESFGWGATPGEESWTLDHYRRLLTDREVRRSLGLTLGVAMLATLVSAGVGVAVALALREVASRSRVINTLVQIPLAMPHLTMAIVLLWIVAPSGLLARVAFQAGWIASPADFPALVQDPYGIGIFLAYSLKEIPFVTLMVLTLLLRLGDEYEDLAQTLGASRGQRWRYVTMPLIAPAALSASLMIFAYLLGAFEIPSLLGRSYPAMLSVVAQRRYQSVDLTDRPGGIALAMMLSLGTALLLLAWVRLTRRWMGTARPFFF
jgi:putative spermidine/putrescine transport system permease protein